MFCSHRGAGPVRPHLQRDGHPMLSHGHRLYLHPRDAGQTASGRLALLLQRIVVGRFPVRDFAADCPLFWRLGSHHAPSMRFFLLSPPSHPGLFHPHVVVRMALGVSSNSVCRRMELHHTLHGNYLSVEGVAYPCDFAPGLSLPYPSSRLIAPQIPRPAPRATTRV
nr:MAG TPA: hypothetical protein [Caudoviricetes sp.]